MFGFLGVAPLQPIGGSNTQCRVGRGGALSSAHPVQTQNGAAAAALFCVRLNEQGLNNVTTFFGGVGRRTPFKSSAREEGGAQRGM